MQKLLKIEKYHFAFTSSKSYYNSKQLPELCVVQLPKIPGSELPESCRRRPLKIVLVSRNIKVDSTETIWARRIQVAQHSCYTPKVVSEKSISHYITISHACNQGW